MRRFLVLGLVAAVLLVLLSIAYLGLRRAGIPIGRA